MDSQEFKGKRVLVTGGARGLGEAVVRAFHKLGATVFALDREEELLKDLKQRLPDVQTVTVDLADWAATQKAVGAILPIHHLVNNAGISAGHHELTDIPEAVLDRVMNINFKQLVNVSQVVAKGLVDIKAEGGSIVNVSSVLATKASVGGSMYCCSKAAVSMLTKCQAMEFGPHNIRVNAIQPSLMETGLVTNPEVWKYLENVTMERQQFKRLLKMEETADLVVFLSSNKSLMITGTVIPIDAGLLLY